MLLRSVAMKSDHRAAAPNYTNACIVMFAINLSWVLIALWAAWGLLAVIAAGWLINRTITHIEDARA